MRIAYHRGRLAATLRDYPGPQGGMMAVGLAENKMQAYLSNMPDLQGEGGVTIACVNSPGSVTLSGAMPQIERLQEILTDD